MDEASPKPGASTKPDANTGADASTGSDAVMGNYGRIDLAFDHGDGAWLVTPDGTRYLDCAAGIAVNTLGHNHPRLVAALKEQAGRLWHVSNLYRIPEQEAVAGLLTRAAGLERAFFCNSGAEATEAAVKMARRAMYQRGLPERMTILCAEGAFHGRTLAMLAATDRPAFREGFGPMPGGFDHVPFGNMNALRHRLISDSEQDSPQIAAVMIESIQGEGGARPLPDGFLIEARALCDETGCLLIADEVQIGIGRSGHLFSFEPSGITPDIVAMAKGLGGGFPVGAVLTSEAVAAAMTPGSHGSTFGGNPLAMAVARAVLEVLGEAGFMADVRRRAGKLRHGLDRLAADMPEIVSVRGGGMLLGLVLAPAYAAVGLADMLRCRHILSVPASGNTLRLLPPLTISDDEIDLLLGVLGDVLPQLPQLKEM